MKKSIQIFMVIVLAVIAGCDGVGPDAAVGPEGADAASLSFRMEWVDEPVPLTLAAAVKLSDDCSGRGVSNVRVSVRDSSGASLKSATFDCSARQGTLAGVTPGSNRTIRVSGLNSSGTETWRGEKTGVTLVAGDNNIGTIQVERVNNQSPTASITSPSNNSSFTSGQSITFTGTGTDSEDGTLSASAFVWTSNRDGQIKTGQKSFSTGALSAGTHTITLTVTDSDGATGSKSITITITTPNQSPTAAITSPANNSTYTYGDIVSFVGTGTDPEDGALSASAFVWTSNRDGQIKTGQKSFSTSALSVGTHTITLTVTDSDGATGTATRSITITTSASGDTFTNALGMTFVKINPGTFFMGSPADEAGRVSDETRHQVTLKGYYLQTTEVTQGQWEAVMGENPSYFSSCGDNCPVESVSWDDVQEFITAMNRRGEGTYRLPTEAEWEYAARAGTTTPFAFGNCLSTSQANYDGNYPLTGCPTGTYRETPVAVGTLGKNAWGLYDMHGNVWEWCSDRYGSYPSSAVTDPTGPSSGAYRVLRGGSWGSIAQYCRSAGRVLDYPDYGGSGDGFRLAVLPGH